MSEPAVKPTSDNNDEPTTSQQDQQQQQQQEQQPLPLSVFSILHDIQTTLSHRFPSPRTGSSSSSAPYLHPYIRHSVQSADQSLGPGQGQEYEPSSSGAGLPVPWTEECARLRASMKVLRVGVGRFRDSWRGEKERVSAAAAGGGGGGGGQEVVGAGEVDDVVRQRKTVLLRIMIDWCTNQHSLLPVSAILASLLSRSHSHAYSAYRPSSSKSNRRHLRSSPRSNARTRTPFVQPQTLSSPTDRIIALAQSIRLDVSLDNEDPSFGMGMAMETETETRLGNEAGPLPSSSSLSAAGAAGTDDIGNVVRVDTLALAGQRMVIDIELAHPCNSARNSHTNTDTNMSTNKEANVKGNGNGKTKGARGKGWTANSLRVERVDPEHLNLASTTGTGGEGGMNDVDNLPPLLSSTAAGDAGLASSGSAIPGTRVLEAQSLVLEQYLQKYLDAVNRYNDSERHWHMYHETLQQEDDDEDEESLELQAERAILAFGDQLADLRAVDLKMQPLDAPVEAAAAAAAAMDKISRQADVAVDVDMDAVKPAEGDDVVLWDQLNEIHSLLKASGAYLSIPQRLSVLPQFQPFPEPTFLVNPLCRIVLSETATPAQFNGETSTTNLTGWAIALDEPVLVSKGFFGHTGTNGGKAGFHGILLPERGVEDLCGVDRSRSYTYKGSSGIQQAFLFPYSGNAGMMIDYIGIRSKEDILSTSKALRNALWISHLLESCVACTSEGSVADQVPDTCAPEENLDDELDKLLTSSAMSSTLKPRNLSIIVQPKSHSLDISFPITVSSIHTPNPVMLSLVIQPNANTGKVDVVVSADALGDVQAQEQVDAYLRGRADGNELADRLVSFEGDVPRWLDTVCADLYR